MNKARPVHCLFGAWLAGRSESTLSAALADICDFELVPAAHQRGAPRYSWSACPLSGVNANEGRPGDACFCWARPPLVGGRLIGVGSRLRRNVFVLRVACPHMPLAASCISPVPLSTPSSPHDVASASLPSYPS